MGPGTVFTTFQHTNQMVLAATDFYSLYLKIQGDFLIKLSLKTLIKLNV